MAHSDDPFDDLTRALDHMQLFASAAPQPSSSSSSQPTTPAAAKPKRAKRKPTGGGSAYVRATDPFTSHAAAEAAEWSAPSDRDKAAFLLKHRAIDGGLTHEELLAAWLKEYGWVPDSTPRKRCGDLVKKEVPPRAADSLTERALRSGKMGIVWCAVCDRSHTGTPCLDPQCWLAP